MATNQFQTPFTIPCRCYNPECGYNWIQRLLTPPRKCPKCQSRHWYDPTWWNRKPQPKQTTLNLSTPTQPGQGKPGDESHQSNYGQPTTTADNERQIPPDTDPGPLPQGDEPNATS